MQRASNTKAADIQLNWIYSTAYQDASVQDRFASHLSAMSGLFKSPAPDSAFSLGDDEDPSLGEVGHAVSVWKAQPAANVAHGSALLALGNGSVHVDNSQPPPAEASISKPSTQSRTVEQEGGAQADAAQDLQANGKHESPGSQVDHPQTSSSESRPTAQPSAQADSFTPSPLPHHEGESSPVAASQPSKSEEEDRIAEVGACCKAYMLLEG